MNDIKIYRGKISYLLPFSFFPVLITIATYGDAGFDLKSGDLWLIPVMSWIFFVIFLFIPKLFKLEISDRYVQKITCGIRTANMLPDTIEAVSYGKIGLWNVVTGARGPTIYGNGLIILANMSGVRKVIGISEKLYGQDAINEAKHILGCEKLEYQ